MRSRVEFWTVEKARGAISSDELLAGQDAFVPFSQIDADGFRELSPGDLVELEAVPTVQDSFRWTVERVRVLEHGPAPALRRREGRAQIEPDGTKGPPSTRL